MSGPADQHAAFNHLASARSPYLLQHAQNPVDWYPWGDEAFRRATAEDRPVFLSIGYATCHWCHVMAHESFEDQQIAALLNESYIPVKVDREERPDIDSIYMAACQRMTGRGGWPLTIIMTPEKKPFFAGTYLPRTTRAGMTGLSELLKRIAQLWKERRGMLDEAAGDLTDGLREALVHRVKGTAGRSLLEDGYQALVVSFDPVNGGFSHAPKFPQPSTLMFLLRYGRRTGSAHALSMAEATLDAMASGGIHDHLGGGFHRYSTDARWLVPHFEKMLYDQALLLTAYTEAWLATKKPLYRRTAESIITYVSRDLMSPDGAFYSAEDADSEGGEGAFYLWTEQEILDCLGSGNGRFAAGIFGATGTGNFRSPEAKAGGNVLSLPGGDPDQRQDPARIAAVRAGMFSCRNTRPRPSRDEKILTDGNALMIAALATASRAFGEPAYGQMAERAMRFILEQLTTPGGGLLHRWFDGDAAVPAFADDYAFMIRALVELYGTGFDPAWLDEAIALERYLTGHFLTPERDGYYFTGDTGDPLIARTVEIHDGAVPSANSMMLDNLVILGHLTGDTRFEEQASRLAGGFAGSVRQALPAHTAYLAGLDHLLGPAEDIVIAGDSGDPVAEEMLRQVRSRFLPSCTVLFRSPEHARSLDRLAPFTKALDAKEGKTVAYFCTGHACSVPVTSAGDLVALLGRKENDRIRGS